MDKNAELALWMDENDDRSVLFYNKAVLNENPEIQQRIRDIYRAENNREV